MSWDAELQRKSRKIVEGLDNYVAYRHFKFFENVLLGILISHHHIPGAGSGHESHKKFEDLHCAQLVNYILEPIKKMSITGHCQLLVKSKHQDHSELLCSSGF
jgi:hypothetical protein